MLVIPCPSGYRNLILGWPRIIKKFRLVSDLQWSSWLSLPSSWKHRLKLLVLIIHSYIQLRLNQAWGCSLFVRVLAHHIGSAEFDPPMPTLTGHQFTPVIPAPGVDSGGSETRYHNGLPVVDQPKIHEIQSQKEKKANIWFVEIQNSAPKRRLTTVEPLLLLQRVRT